MEEKKSKKKIVLLTIFVLLLAITIGLSYAFLTTVLTGEKQQVIKAGVLSLNLDDTTSEGINITDAYPMSDSDGMNQDIKFTFSLTNEGTIDSMYTIYLEDDDIDEGDVRLDASNVRYNLTKDTVASSAASIPTNRVIDQGTISKGDTIQYELRLWLKEDMPGDVEGQVFSVKLAIEASQLKENSTLLSTTILDKANNSSITTYQNGDTKEMYTFSHTAAAQQSGWSTSELTDYRYIGNTPNNYITFNNELWRIIGVFTVENELGEKEQRVKIIRNNFLTPSLSWDNSSVQNAGIYSYGQNRWATSRLMKVLNPGYEEEAIGGSLYWNSMRGVCYAGSTTDAKKNCNFTNQGLTDEAKEQIGDTKWYLGGSYGTATISAETFYIEERGTNVYNGNNNYREINWIGKIGLMYVSDYGYTFAANVDYRCYNSLGSCYVVEGGGGGNPNRSWMTKNDESILYENLLNPVYNYIDMIFALYHYKADQYRTGYITDTYAHGDFGVRPALYLKSDVLLISGDGSRSSPFIIK